MSDALYVYGIAEAGSALDTATLGPGIAGGDVRLVSHGALQAIVGAAPEGPIEGTRRNMLTHTAVLERAHAITDVLPLRFGTVATDEALLTHGIAESVHTLRQALVAIAGRTELGVKASWRDGIAYREILESEPSLRSLRDRLQARPTAETYYERIELGRRVEAALAARREADTGAILAELAPLAEREEALKTLDDTMVLNRAFLVRRDSETNFDAAMERLGLRFGERMEFRYIGPVPPYNFVSLRAGWLPARR